MFKFFIDTANINYINGTIKNIISRGVSRSSILGITTNPNAMAKINHYSLESWVSVLPKLCETVSQLRGDSLGRVHVQAPNSKMSGEEVVSFAKYISNHNDGNTKLALKIAPRIGILSRISEIQEHMPVNVTGLADCSSALVCLSHGVDYVSIIPGRMEEMGLDADSHLSFLMKRKKGNGEVITGSMRTVEGLLRAVSYNTIPTIGEKVWDQLVDTDLTKKADELNYFSQADTANLSPLVSRENIELSLGFFEQMDKQGKQAHKDYINL
jgi:transaldolase